MGKKGKLNFVSKIQCKSKVSNNLKNDLVIVGSFVLKTKIYLLNHLKK